MDASEQKLMAKIHDADLIAVGMVVGIKEDKQKGPISEHDPNWHVASVIVKRILRGESSSRIAVRFAASNDVAWYRSPKLSGSQEVILILNRADDEIIYTLSEVQPKSNLETVERFLKK